MKGKYGNKKVIVDNVKFDSKLEARRYKELALMLQVGEITKLELHPRHRLMINGNFICTYVADFSYVQDGARVVEDVKGVQTAVFKIKWKMLKVLFKDTYDKFEIWVR